MGQVVIFDGSPATGVSSVNDNSQMSIYPNPATDIVNINLQGNKNQFDLMNIYDVFGKVVYTEKINSNNNNLIVNTTSFSQGIFKVQLLGENISTIKSFIIQK